MYYRMLKGTNLKVSEIGLGTWVLGGWLWSGIDEKEAINTVKEAIESGINLIDTAPVYGFGKSEEIVGKGIKGFDREKIIIATKVGLEWDENERIKRNSSRKRILKEIEDSLKRLDIEYIDIYQIHWPDKKTPFKETMETMMELKEKGLIKYIGVSNFSVEQMEECKKYGEFNILQPPYNFFEREIQNEILPYCIRNNIGILAYGALCRGLLTGKFKGDETFGENDIRHFDPKFQGDTFKKYAELVKKLDEIAQSIGKRVSHLAIRWLLQQNGVDVALVGMRNRKQLKENLKATDFVLEKSIIEKMEKIFKESNVPILSPKFMAPPD